MKKLLAAAACILLLLSGLVYWLNVRDEAPIPVETAAIPADSQTIERGRYLTRAGNCMGCHTARGGAAFAGGVALITPFGTIYSTNLTPDAKTGIGDWNAAHFWRAMHNGRAKDGRLLYPAFPYPNFTHITRVDSDAIHSYLRSLPAVQQANRAHELRFPYGLQASLAVWRAAFFKPADYVPEPGRSAEWNRGAYLTRGLGHCGACHTPRNALGATDVKREFQGALVSADGWYAPSLSAEREAGVALWDQASVAHLLQSGIAPQRWVSGPMAEVVWSSTQYLSQADAMAMAHFLKSLPASGSAVALAPAAAPPPAMLAAGAKLYEQHCASCHGADGKGVPGAYPPLAGSRAVMLDSPANLIQITLNGGYAPSTAANPRPFGMPPFAPFLDDREVAAVLSFVRNAWGNQGSVVSELNIRKKP